jgi:hypothetical protein
MSRLTQDARYALRTFFRGRFVTVLAVLAFALGIGVTTAVFSIFAGVLLSPLPYPNDHGLTWDSPFELYYSIRQQPYSAMTVVMRTAGR